MNLMDPTHPRSLQMRAILAALGPQQSPQMTDPAIMGQGNPMATAPINPAGAMGPANPMLNNPMLQLPKVFGR